MNEDNTPSNNQENEQENISNELNDKKPLNKLTYIKNEYSFSNNNFWEDVNQVEKNEKNKFDDEEEEVIKNYSPKLLLSKLINKKSSKIKNKIFLLNMNFISLNSRKKSLEKKNTPTIEEEKIFVKKKKNIKVDKLSVFNRNIKWLEDKNQRLTKEVERYNNIKEQQILQAQKLKLSTDIDINIFKEEDNVMFKPENYKYFMRQNEVRKKKEKNFDVNNSYTRINLLRKSHYSGRQNVRTKDMNKFITFIHNELKGTKN